MGVKDIVEAGISEEFENQLKASSYSKYIDIYSNEWAYSNEVQIVYPTFDLGEQSEFYMISHDLIAENKLFFPSNSQIEIMPVEPIKTLSWFNEEVPLLSRMKVKLILNEEYTLRLPLILANIGGLGSVEINEITYSLSDENLINLISARNEFFTNLKFKAGSYVELDFLINAQRFELNSEAKIDVDVHNLQILINKFSNQIIKNKENYSVHFDLNFDDVDYISRSVDENIWGVGKANDFLVMINPETLSFNDEILNKSDLMALYDTRPIYKLLTVDSVSYKSPIPFVNNSNFNLDYQLIDYSDNVVVIGSSHSEFISLKGKGNKAIDSGDGNDILDVGISSGFMTGGYGSDNFFFDGRTNEDIWSTITDFNLAEDKITIWGWWNGASRISSIIENRGAEGYQGLTIYFENLTFDNVSSQNNNDVSIKALTLSGLTSDFLGDYSLSDLNKNIETGLSNLFSTGYTNDDYGQHGYLTISI